MSTRLGVFAGLCLSLFFFPGCIVDPPGADLDTDECTRNSDDCAPQRAADGGARNVVLDGFIERNDENEHEARDAAIELSQPCVRLSQNQLEYSANPLGQSTSRVLRIESCGGRPVTITGVRIIDDPDQAFGLVEEWPMDPVELAGYGPADEAAGHPAPSREIEVSFAPDEIGVFNGRLVVTSSARETPQLSAQLLGRGVANSCPRAVVSGEMFTVGLQDIVVLDGSPSIDVDGTDNRPVRYEWTVIDRPLGSRVQPTESNGIPWDRSESEENDDPATPRAYFAPDTVGQYTLELNVVDEQGVSSRECEATARTTVVLEAPDGLHLQLTWRTPGDLDPDDRDGADLDLYLAHPLALEWGGRPSDVQWTCFSLNPRPDWGEVNSAYGNPHLALDVIDGRAPENITLAAVEHTSDYDAPYLVGVHYYRDSGFGRERLGPSYARLHVYYDNTMVWSFDGSQGDEEPGERVLQRSDTFWGAIQITYPELEVNLRDRMYTERP